MRVWEDGVIDLAGSKVTGSGDAAMQKIYGRMETCVSRRSECQSYGSYAEF